MTRINEELVGRIVAEATGPFSGYDEPVRESAMDEEQEAYWLKQAILQGRLDSLSDLPPVFERFKQPSRYKGAHGGRGGMKSHLFAEMLISRCNRKRTRAVCVREYQVSLEQSVKRLLEDKIEFYCLGDRFRVLTSHIETPHDGIIIFQGMQNHTAQSIKSLEGYDIAWVEEAQSLSQRSLDLLRPTIRKEFCRFCDKEGPLSMLVDVPCIEGHEHKLDPSELWFSWNPENATDPVDAMLRDRPPPGAIVIESTYKDNPFFPDVLQTEMLWDQQRDIEKYIHVWEGGYQKNSEARVFKNWRVQEFEAPAKTVFYLGADWGFSVDPSTMVRCFVDGRKLYIDHECYQMGTEIDYLPALFDGLVCGCVPERDGTYARPCLKPEFHGDARGWESVADSARPETISYLTRHGYPRMIAAKKGPGSVKEGVTFLQNYDIIVHPRCVHTKKELTSYAYKVDKLTSIVTPVLVDDKNHIIDPMRYATEKLRDGDEFVSW